MERKFNMIEQLLREMCSSNEYTLEELAAMKNMNLGEETTVQLKKEEKGAAVKRVKCRKIRWVG